MNLPYTMRLLCLCCASFFMIHMALALATRLSAGTALRIAEHMKASSAARFLFALRLAPLVLTLFAVLAFCIPSYLWLEPEATGEKVGLFCVFTALMGVAIWAFSLVRVAGAVRGTNRYLHECERHGRKINVNGSDSPALLLADKTPVMAVAGVFHPRLVVSKRVLHGLSAEQREAALSHEQAHCVSGDNFKRLLILLAPEIMPFVSSFRTLDRGWSKFTEWAADDEASAGDPQRALTLASALVRVAKMGAKPRLSYLSCSLVGGDKELSERVDRLLRPQPKPGKPVREVISLLSSLTGLTTAAVVVMFIWPNSLTLVHQALERLVH
jgi:beta-lactamase regulating signal transducer with metallopeptidase domain